MDEPLRGPLSGLPLREAVVVAVILQLLVWLVTAALLDGGACFRACSCGLAVHWAGVGPLGRAAWRSRPGRLFVEVGWVPLVAAALWLGAALRA